MNLPSEDTLISALEATWPPVTIHRVGPWCVREGAGGGQRVSATTDTGGALPSDVPLAESLMAELGQTNLFMIRRHEQALDAALAARGYLIKDPVSLYVAPTSSAGPLPEGTTALAGWPPLALQRDIWLEDGIGPARIAVMDRASAPKAALLIREGNTPAAVAFVSNSGKIAYLHALFVPDSMRRRGFGRLAMQAAFAFADRNGADWLALAVVRENTGAVALYSSLGMVEAGAYHYRAKP